MRFLDMCFQPDLRTMPIKVSRFAHTQNDGSNSSARTS
jgi:hypothetical protein